MGFIKIDHTWSGAEAGGWRLGLRLRLRLNHVG